MFSSGIGYLHPKLNTETAQNTNESEGVGYITPNLSCSRTPIIDSPMEYHRISTEEPGNDEKVCDSNKKGYISIDQVGTSGTSDTNTVSEGYITMPKVIFQQ